MKPNPTVCTRLNGIPATLQKHIVTACDGAISESAFVRMVEQPFEGESPKVHFSEIGLPVGVIYKGKIVHFYKLGVRVTSKFRPEHTDGFSLRAAWASWHAPRVKRGYRSVGYAMVNFITLFI